MKTAIFLFILSFGFFSAQAETGWTDTEIRPQGQLHSWLKGRWQNTVGAMELPEMAREENAGPETSETAVLQYHFLEDGVFVRSIDHGAAHFEERGRWEIAADGQSILLHFPGRAMEKAAIKYIELDEMVLEQPLHIPGSNWGYETRQLFFNKV